MKQFVLLCVLFGLVVAKERTITVKGTGIIDVEPDQAVVYFTPYSNSFSGKWTSQTPADAFKSLLQSIKEKFPSVDKNDIRVQLPTHRGTRGIKILVRDLSIVEELMKLGEEKEVGVQLQYTHSDIQRYQREAEKLAVKDAINKASSYAAETFVHLVEVCSIEETKSNIIYQHDSSNLWLQPLQIVTEVTVVHSIDTIYVCGTQ
eukprot:TRINITY_DN1266_c0_g1_i1.p1 TRINITY_DN1266_c0_g1~~TRINITY_DN1266_c0_g1_i1.p1  ORF type:complete len:204 (+),score=52.05 TRINITY_DN1266_c0_g1_i1:126-737(+)